MLSILLIDDDPISQVFVPHALEAAGHRVLTATNGAAAIQVLGSSKVDAVLLEVLLPDRDGLEIIGDIKQRWPAMPIIAMSAGRGLVAGNQALRLATSLGACAALHKPFSGSELLDALRYCLAASAA